MMYTATNWQDAQRRVFHAYRQWLRSVSWERWILLEAPKADSKSCIRLLKSNKCIHSIYPCLSYERKYDKSLRDTDLSTSCRWWTCCYFRATPNFRYIISLVHSRRLHAARLSNHRVKSTEWMLMQHISGNTKLLEADTTRYEIFPGDRESDSKIACRFHARLSGGRNCDYSSNNYSWSSSIQGRNWDICLWGVSYFVLRHAANQIRKWQRAPNASSNGFDLSKYLQVFKSS